MENEEIRVLGRFVRAGEEIEQEWIRMIVSALTTCAQAVQEDPSRLEEKIVPTLPEFQNSFAELKYWASREGLHHMFALMDVVFHDEDDPIEVCQYCADQAKRVIQ